MASAVTPRIREAGSSKATTKNTTASVSLSVDSRENLLTDVMREINAGIDEMNATERTRAIAGIHAIAENVRKRQA